MIGQPELRCYGTLVVFEEAEAVCDLHGDCEALLYRYDFGMYRAAHAHVVSADVVMDPDVNL